MEEFLVSIFHLEFDISKGKDFIYLNIKLFFIIHLLVMVYTFSDTS